MNRNIALAFSQTAGCSLCCFVNHRRGREKKVTYDFSFTLLNGWRTEITQLWINAFVYWFLQRGKKPNLFIGPNSIKSGFVFSSCNNTVGDHDFIFLKSEGNKCFLLTILVQVFQQIFITTPCRVLLVIISRNGLIWSPTYKQSVFIHWVFRVTGEQYNCSSF